MRIEFLSRIMIMEVNLKIYGKIAIAASLIYTITACSHVSRKESISTPEILNESISSPEILADCFVDFYLSAWDDLDGNGFRDTSEPSLEGVAFRIDGRFASILSKYPCISDDDGQCIISTWAPGECAAGNYTITAVPQESYEPTTPTSITLSLTPVDFSREAQFGFRALSK